MDAEYADRRKSETKGVATENLKMVLKKSASGVLTQREELVIRIVHDIGSAEIWAAAMGMPNEEEALVQCLHALTPPLTNFCRGQKLDDFEVAAIQQQISFLSKKWS